MSKSQKSNTGKNTPNKTPKTVPVKPHGRTITNSRPKGIPKGYKPTESTHQAKPPSDSGSGLKDN